MAYRLVAGKASNVLTSAIAEKNADTTATFASSPFCVRVGPLAAWRARVVARRDRDRRSREKYSFCFVTYTLKVREAEPELLSAHIQPQKEQR